MHTIYMERLRDFVKRKPVAKPVAVDMFAGQLKNSIFHQVNSIRLSKVDAERVAIATNELEKASAALHGAYAALVGFDDIDKSHLSMAHNYIHAYIYMFSEFSLQSVGARKPNFENLQKARNGGA